MPTMTGHVTGRPSGAASWRHVRTERLRLDEPVDADAADLFAIHTDPASWQHFPSGRVTDPAAGSTMVGASRRRFDRISHMYTHAMPERTQLLKTFSAFQPAWAPGHKVRQEPGPVGIYADVPAIWDS